MVIIYISKIVWKFQIFLNYKFNLFENNNSYRNGFYYEYVIIKYTFVHIYKNLKIHNFFKNYIKWMAEFTKFVVLYNIVPVHGILWNIYQTNFSTSSIIHHGQPVAGINYQARNGRFANVPIFNMSRDFKKNYKILKKYT